MASDLACRKAVQTEFGRKGTVDPFPRWCSEVIRDKNYLGRTYGRILDFSFGGRAENRYEMALELVSGADSKCILHHF
jgi:hypothetical protein